MRVKRFELEEGGDLSREVRVWAFESWRKVDVMEVKQPFVESENRDQILRELTARFDATEVPPGELKLAVDAEERVAALSRVDARLRASLELAAANIRAVAEAQMEEVARRVTLSQGQTVTIREVPVKAAGIYAPGGRAAYPTSVLMCAIPARVAGVERIALATPPGPDGKVNPTVLAAAALCGVDEVYAIGGAQAIFALAFGTETIDRVNVVAGPGNDWVREAKADVSNIVAIDSLAGPSELMIVVDESSNLSWAALDLCAQAEHGEESTLIAACTDDDVLTRLAEETERAAASRSGVGNAPLALIKVPARRSRGRFRQRFRARAPAASERRPDSARRPGRHRRLRLRRPPTAPPPSATTPLAPTTCFRPRRRPASPARSARAPSGARSPPLRSPPTLPRSSRRTSIASLGRRDSPFTASQR